MTVECRLHGGVHVCRPAFIDFTDWPGHSMPCGWRLLDRPPVAGTAQLKRRRPTSPSPTTVAVSRGADLLTRAPDGGRGTALSAQGTMVVEFSFLGGLEGGA